MNRGEENDPPHRFNNPWLLPQRTLHAHARRTFCTSVCKLKLTPSNDVRCISEIQSMDHFYDSSGRLSRKIAQKSSIHQLPALAKFSPRLPGLPAIFLTPNGPIPTLFRSIFDICFFSIKVKFCFRCFALGFS